MGKDTENLQLTDSSGNDICSKVEIPSFETVKCTTKALEISTAQELKVKLGSTSYQCGNTDSNQCKYQTTSSFP